MSSTSTHSSGQIVDERLDNGLRVVIEPMRDISSAAAGFMARAGSRDEPREWAGVSHFLEHMCFKGTRKRPWQQITIDFDNLGSYYNAFTSKENTVYFGWVRGGDIDKQIELLADMIRPTLPPEEFDMERKVILEEIAMSDDDLDRHMYDLIHEKMFEGHSLAWPVLGYRETVEKLRRQDMLDYHAQQYSPANIVLIVAGNVDIESILRTAREVTADWTNVGKAPPRRPPNSCMPARPACSWNASSSSASAVATPCGPAGAGEERIEAITSILGGENSRFFWNITQKGISPRSGLWGVVYADCGVQLQHSFGEPEKTEQMFDAMRRRPENSRKPAPSPRNSSASKTAAAPASPLTAKPPTTASCR